MNETKIKFNAFEPMRQYRYFLASQDHEFLFLINKVNIKSFYSTTIDVILYDDVSPLSIPYLDNWIDTSECTSLDDLNQDFIIKELGNCGDIFIEWHFKKARPIFTNIGQKWNESSGSWLKQFPIKLTILFQSFTIKYDETI